MVLAVAGKNISRQALESPAFPKPAVKSEVQPQKAKDLKETSSLLIFRCISGYSLF